MKTFTQWLSWLTDKPPEDIVDEASKESFPASDPPAWALSPHVDNHNETQKEDPVFILKAEHQLIMRIVYQIHEQIERLEKNQPFKLDSLQKIIVFMRRFVDKFHHQKEEEYFFPTLEKCGAPIADVAIDDFKKDHEQALVLVTILEKYAPLYAKKEPGAREKSIETMMQLKDIYIRHTLKAENFVFPLAKKYLSKAEQKYLFDQFEKVDAKAHA